MKDKFLKKAMSIALIVIIVHSLGYYYYRVMKYSYLNEGFKESNSEEQITELQPSLNDLEKKSTPPEGSTSREGSMTNALSSKQKRNSNNNKNTDADEANEDADDGEASDTDDGEASDTDSMT